MSIYSDIKKAIYPDGHSHKFIPQFRVEGSNRDPDNEDNLAMRIADPLWMLGRQWQFGEFLAEDNGSPIQVTAHYRKLKLDVFSASGDSRTLLNGMPLEVYVEAMEAPIHDLRTKVRIGQQLERIIKRKFEKAAAQNYIRNLRSTFKLSPNKWTNEDKKTLDNGSDSFFRLMAKKAIDGHQVIDKVEKDESYFSTGSFAGLLPCIKELYSWYKDSIAQPNPGKKECWVPNQLLHKFQVHQKQHSGKLHDICLTAPDYQSGELDWYSFDTLDVKGDTYNQLDKEAPDSRLPIHVTFGGIPDKRLYSFEDNKIDLGSMDLEAKDLLRMMLVDFSLVSGSDWYAIGLKMGLGELCWIDKIEVKDVFGVVTTITNGQKLSNTEKVGPQLSDNPLEVWDVFKIRKETPSYYEQSQHPMYLAPVVNHRQESEPIEELLFVRDEFANMVWAVERKVQNEMGDTVEGFELHLEHHGPFQEEDTPEQDEAGTFVPGYQLATNVPSNWIPFLPIQISEGSTQIELQRALMLRNTDNDNPTDIESLSRLAKELERVREEAVPRAGVRIQLTKQRVRWTDGRTYVWLGRKVLTGRGEGNSGIRFDEMK